MSKERKPMTHGYGDVRLAGRTVIFNSETTPYTNRLFEDLKESGCDISVMSCVKQEANRAWAKSIHPTYRHMVLRGFTIRLSEARFAHINFGIFSRLRELKPSRLIIYGIFPSMLMAVLWARFNKVPFGLYTDGWAGTMPTTIYHRLVRPFILKRCAAVACCGTKGAAYVRGQGVDEDRVFIVPIVPGWEGPAKIARFDEREFDILWCAHMNDSAKNVSFFLDVVLRLKKQLSNLKVRLVGEGPMKRAVLKRLEVAKVFYRHDSYIDWFAMASVFTSSKLLLFPSLWEPWGLVCNEAMQCGTPAIASPAAGAADDLVVSGANGLILPLDAKQWASEAQRILTDQEEWNRLSKSALGDSRCRTMSRSVAQYKRFLEAVCDPASMSEAEAARPGRAHSG